MMNPKRTKLLLKLFAVCAALLMVMGAYLGAYCGALEPFVEMFSSDVEGMYDVLAQYSRIGILLSSVAAVVFSWISGKLEKPWRLFAISTGAGCVLVLGVMGYTALNVRMLSQVAMRQAGGDMLLAALLRFLLTLALLLAVVWLLSGMVRRHLGKKENA